MFRGNRWRRLTGAASIVVLLLATAATSPGAVAAQDTEAAGAEGVSDSAGLVEDSADAETVPEVLGPEGIEESTGTAAAGGPDALPVAEYEPESLESTVPDVGSLGWVPVLDEEFDGGELDTDLWRPWYYGGAQRSMESIRVDDSVADDSGEGYLTLTTFSRQDADGNVEHFPGGVTLANKGDVRHPADAGFLPTYGYLEARVRMRPESGTTATLWTMPMTGHASPFGDTGISGPEIDIFEWSGSEDDVGGRTHWDGFDEHHKTVGMGLPGGNPTETPIWDEFHEWSLLWTPDGYRMYLDGHEYYRSDDALTYRPQRLIISQIQHGWNGSPPAGGYGGVDESTNTMEVDYVRWWQRPVAEVPDQSVGAGEPFAAPTSVTDYRYGSPTRDDPGSVRVEATSSNQALLPDENLTVAGNGPVDPDGEFTNGAFSEGEEGWVLTGNASVVPEGDGQVVHSAPNALHLEDGGGRAEQTVTGLEPNTTYILGTWFNIEAEWTDDNENGLVDCSDAASYNGRCPNAATRESIQDGNASFEWGVADTDSTRPEAQHVRTERMRNLWQEQQSPGWRYAEGEFRHDYLQFTTGPDTTDVTLYWDNTNYAGTSEDSNVTLDSLYIEPLAPPARTVAGVPEPGESGEATVTVTAYGADNEVIGTEDFNVFVSPSSFANGGFEAAQADEGWELLGEAEVVEMEDPFTHDNFFLELGRDGNDTATQHVVGLEPDTEYVLEASGRVHDGEGSASTGVIVNGTGGESGVVTFSTGGWQEDTTTFTTGPDSTEADIVALDWNTPSLWAQIDDIRIYAAEASATSYEPTPPALGDIEEVHLGEGDRPVALAFDQGALSITGVASDNPHLLPDADIAAVGNGSTAVVSATPTMGRMGQGAVSVAYVDDEGNPAEEQLPVVVSHHELENTGFEEGEEGWCLVSVAIPEDPCPAFGQQHTDSGQRTGGAAVEISGDEVVGQRVDGLDYNRTYMLGGSVRGDVTVTVRTSQRPNTNHPEVIAEQWAGSDWTEGHLTFSTGSCPSCSPSEGGTNYEPEWGTVDIEISATDSAGDPVVVDDLYLLQAPSMQELREVEIDVDTVEPGAWATRNVFNTGGVPVDTLWREGVLSVESSNENVVPLENIYLNNDYDEPVAWHRPGWPYEWDFQVVSNGVTGVSDVTFTLTDPWSGATTSQTFPVSVNAGSFDNGTFESGLAGWERTWLNPHHNDVRRRRPWRFLGSDRDSVFRTWSGVVGYRVDALEADTDYAVQGAAFGDGSYISVRANTHEGCVDSDPETGCIPLFGQELGRVDIDSSASWAPVETPEGEDLQFTTLTDVAETSGDETGIWIFIVDPEEEPPEGVDWGDPGEGSPERDQAMRDYYNYYPCFRERPGQSCFDNLGLYRVSDLG